MAKKKLAIFSTFGKILKLSFSELYNSLGYAILMSSIWFIAALPVLFLAFSNMIIAVKGLTDQQIGSMFIPTLVFSMLIISFWNGLVLGPAMAMLFAVHQERKESYISFRSFLNYFKKFYWISARVFWAFSFGVSLIGINFLISLGQNGLIPKIGGMFSIYVLFFLMNMPLFFLPLIYYKHKFTDVFYKAFLLVMDNLVLSLLISVFIGFMLALCGPTVILLVLIFGAFYLLMVDNAFELISKKYEAE